MSQLGVTIDQTKVRRGFPVLLLAVLLAPLAALAQSATLDSLPETVVADPSDAVLVVNQGEGAGRTTAKISPDNLRRASIPTAADLSEPGALQAWIDAHLGVSTSLANPGSNYGAAPVNPQFGGPIPLPRGTIRYAEQLEIRTKYGGTIQGVGTPNGRIGGSGAQQDPRSDTATRLVFTGSSDTPAVFLKGASRLTFRDLSIEHENSGTCVKIIDDVGGGRQNGFENVVFGAGATPGGIGVEHGNPTSNTAAGTTFNRCFFEHVQHGVVVNHDQGLEYGLYNCDFQFAQNAIWLKRGGAVSTFNCNMAGIYTGELDGDWTFLKLGDPEATPPTGGGPNTQPCTIVGLRMDKVNSQTGAARRNICVVDAVKAGSVCVGVYGLNIETESSGEDRGLAQRLFRVNHLYAGGNRQRIVVGHSNLMLGANGVAYQRRPNPAFDGQAAYDETTNNPYVEWPVTDPRTGSAPAGDARYHWVEVRNRETGAPEGVLVEADPDAYVAYP